MSSTCFESEGSSSGRRLCIRVWYSVLYMHQYNRLPEDEPSGSKHVEDIKKLKIKILI